MALKPITGLSLATGTTEREGQSMAAGRAPIRILVCGGRDFDDYPLVRKVLDSLFPTTEDMSTWLPPPGTTIIHGGASGADDLADQWAVVNWVRIEEYSADWTAHGRAAGPIRNQEMIDKGKPDLVVAFPGGRGTADMVKRAEKAGIPVLRIEREPA